DVSYSMASQGKLAALQETLKLPFTILNGTLHVITFADDAVIEGSHDLQLQDARRRAMAKYAGLATRSGTNYIAAIQKVRELRLAPGTKVVFISDGEPTTGGDREAILSAVKASGLTFCTVAVQAAPAAKSLLTEMAQLSGGMALAAETGEDLTRHLIALAFDVEDYMVFQPRIPGEEFRWTIGGGSILALGYDAVPAVEGPLPTDARLEVTAALPGEHVSVMRIELTVTTDVVIRIANRRSARGRFGKVLRNDVRTYRMETHEIKDKPVQAGQSLELLLTPDTPLRDATGAVLPQREPEQAIRIVDVRTGEALAETRAVPQADGKMRATIQVPPAAGALLRLEQVETILDEQGLGEWRRGVRSVSFTTVAPSLNAQIIGKLQLQPGMGMVARVQLQNVSEQPLGIVELQGGAFAVAGGHIEVLPPRQVTVGQGTRTVDVRVMVTAGVTADGAFRVPLRIRRNGADLLTVPIDVQLGEACGMTASPATARINGHAFEVRPFRFRLMATESAVLPDHVQVGTSSLEGSPGLAVDVRLLPSSRLSAGRALSVEGKVLLPGEPGQHRITVTVASDRNGSLEIPLLIDVAAPLP
ncbi:MAG: hypothetical protein AB7F89_08260, partial [Pirellulaceae bacterium]